MNELKVKKLWRFRNEKQGFWSLVILFLVCSSALFAAPDPKFLTIGNRWFRRSAYYPDWDCHGGHHHQ